MEAHLSSTKPKCLDELRVPSPGVIGLKRRCDQFGGPRVPSADSPITTMGICTLPRNFCPILCGKLF